MNGNPVSTSGGNSASSMAQMPPMTIWPWTDQNGWCLPDMIRGMGGPILSLRIQPPNGKAMAASELPPCAGITQMPGMGLPGSRATQSGNFNGIQIPQIPIG